MDERASLSLFDWLLYPFGASVYSSVRLLASINTNQFHDYRYAVDRAVRLIRPTRD